MYMGEPVHPWHYNCYSCGYVELLFLIDHDTVLLLSQP